MRRYFEFYDNTKTYFSPIWEQYTPEVVAQKYPIVNSGFPVVIETDENHIMFYACDLLSQYKAMYDIDKELSDEEALAEINRILNLQQEITPTVEERIAAALEFQNVLLMPNMEGDE